MRPASSQKFYIPGFLSSISVRKLPHFPAKPCPVSVFPCTAEERPWRRNDSSWRRSGLTHLGVVYSEAAVLYDTDSERDHIFRHAGCTLQSAASLEARHCSLDITDYRITKIKNKGQRHRAAGGGAAGAWSLSGSPSRTAAVRCNRGGSLFSLRCGTCALLPALPIQRGGLRL